ncbi:Phage antitermination protein Q [Morganella morganii]|uniref:antiterminator Q family protein n=1 Tax=Morganella morganii TaxID=582 RepID=UPI000DA26E69|nr:antiterminator Q family protein [Morganella morganii]SQL23917.1 Phage antitermination protein Q [Morganella morganii]
MSDIQQSSECLVMSRSIKDWLEAWGNWSSSRTGTEYKGVSYMTASSFGNRPWLDDIEGMVIDQAVGSLKKYDIDGYNIICLHYQHHFSFRAIGKNMGKRHQYVSDYCERAEAYIAGVIHATLKAA